MLPYNFRLAWHSIRRNPILSALMVAAIGVGIGACMTTLTVYYMAAKNPIPHRSDRLFHVQMESFPITPGYEPGEEPPEQITYTDATNLLQANQGYRRAAMFKAAFPLQPEDPDVRPFLVLSRVTGNDFFTMFDVPFLYGGPWDDSADDTPQQVVVLSKSTNEQVFGGENSVGRSVRMGDQEFRVVGVLDDWAPSPKFYDLTNGAFLDVEDTFIPFSLVEPLELDTSGNTNCAGNESVNSYQEFLASECVWITYWVELPDAAARDSFRNFIETYIAEQKEMGRFEREMNYRVRTVAEWLAAEEVADDSIKVVLWLSFLFLLVCLLNTVGLILAKFIGRAPQIALRRALGASRANLFRQHLTEVLVIGTVGGLVGLGLAQLGLIGIRKVMGEDLAIFRMDWTMAGTAILIAIAASAAAGVYPAFRVGRLAPARFLKTQ